MKTRRDRIGAERQRFESYLQKAELKLTPGRNRVFQKVMESHGHFTAEELVKRCQSENYRVSRATVYRSFKELREAGVIRETAFGEKHQHFEHVYDEKLHHHARCIRCYAVLEFPCQQENEQYIKFLVKEKFQILGHELHFYGICQRCFNG